MKYLDFVSFPTSWPGPEWAEGLFIEYDGDTVIVWAETPDCTGWKAQAVHGVSELPDEYVSEALRRQRGLIVDAAIMV